MRKDLVANSDVVEAPADVLASPWRPYRDVGLVAVAIGLELLGDDLGEEMEDALRRGASYIAAASMPLAS